MSAGMATRGVLSRYSRSGAVLTLLISVPLLLGSAPSASAFTALVAFGDSYTDTGNAPSSPPYYWDGRFSNGPLWIEYLSQTLGFAYNSQNNFAVSGTESNELGVEINRFPGTGDSQNVLFAIWSGNNDFGNHLNIGYNDAGWDSQINSVVSSLMTASDLIYQKGARNIILFNQIDLTRVPYILDAYSGTFRSYIAGKIQIFNSRLAQALPNLLNSHPGLQVFLVDVYSDLNYLLDNYSSLGFTHATLDALDDANLSDKSFSGPGADYVFWDSEHPSTKTHNIIAGWVYNVLPAALPPPTITITAPQNGAQFTAPATISIQAAVVSNGWPINQVTFFQNGSFLGQINNPPYTFVLSSFVQGYSTLLAQASYGTGQTVTSGPVQVLVVPPDGPSPPPPWNHMDIGDVGQPGSAYFTHDTFTVSGSGSDIWGAADAFHYVYQLYAGDGAIIARVTSIQDTDGYAKVGLMFRQTLQPDAPNAMTFITPLYGVDFQSRASSDTLSSYVQGVSARSPFWLKLQRRGNTFSGYAAADGTNWVFLSVVTIPMPKTIYVGVAVTAHNNTLLNTATIDNLQLVAPAVPAPRPQPPALAFPVTQSSAQ